MRDDGILSRAISTFMFAASILVLIGICLYGVDQNVQTMVKEETSTFVDNCRTKGEIDPIQLTQYISTLHTCGEFEAEIQVETRIVYPNTTDNGTVTDGKLITDYLIVDHDTIVEHIYMSNYNPVTGEGNETQDYYLTNGDRIQVVVRRTGAGFTSVANLIGLGGKDGDFICQYSGMVAHTK